MTTVACVLRYGGDYDVSHVEALYAGVRAWWPGPLRFVCLTTEHAVERPGIETRPLTRGWPGWWSKMELFAPEHDDLGDVLYLDLDTLITGDLLELTRTSRLTMLRDFYRPIRVNSGLMFLPVGVRQLTWPQWHPNAPWAMKQYRALGDGGFLDTLWRGGADTWQDLLPGRVLSYKVHVRPRKNVVPDGAAVVCFHGKPRPWETTLWDRVEHLRA